jgi:O-antigen ligase
MHRGVVLFLLVLSPLLLGGNRQIIWAIDGLLASIALVALATTTVHDRAVFVSQRRIMNCISAFMLAVAAWMVVQSLPFTQKPFHHSIWALVEPLSARGAISINPSHTISAISFWTTLAVMLVAIREGTNPPFVKRVLKLAALTATGIAVFGFTALVLGAPTLGVAEKESYLGQLTGTFANPNNAATYFCLGMVAALALAASPASAAQSRKGTIWLAIATALFAAVVLTGSRGGMLSAVIAVAVSFALSSRVGTRARMRILLAVIVAAAIVLVAWVGNVGLFGRTDMAASTEVRLSLYQEAIAAIKDRPVLGHGAGTYGDIEPLFHLPGTPQDRVWNRAHSTYLEAAADLGIPAAAAVGTIAVLLIVLLLWAVRAEVSSPTLLAAVPATFAVMVHSTVDFSLQIQGVAILYVVLLGLAIGTAAAAWDGGRIVKRETGLEQPKPEFARLWSTGTALLFALSCVSFVTSSRIALIELSVSPTLWRSELRPFRAIRSDPALTRIARGFALTFLDDPYLHYSSAPECRRIEFSRPPAPPASLDDSARCLAVIDASLHKAPASSELWLSRAEILAQQTVSEGTFLTALRNSYLTGAHEGYLSPARLTLILAHWKSVTPDVRLDALKELRSASEQALNAIAELLIADASHQDTIRSAILAAADQNLRVAFAEAVRRQSDLNRHESDALRSETSPANCVSDCSSVVSIVAAADTYQGAAIFRLWVDGRVVGEASVTAASNSRAGEAVSSDEGQSIEVKIPAGRPRLSLEIEFINDASGPREGLDRNLQIRKVTLNGKVIPLSRFSAPLGSEDAVSIAHDALRFNSNGAARYEANHDGGNWPQ